MNKILFLSLLFFIHGFTAEATITTQAQKNNAAKSAKAGSQTPKSTPVVSKNNTAASEKTTLTNPKSNTTSKNPTSPASKIQAFFKYYLYHAPTKSLIPLKSLNSNQNCKNTTPGKTTKVEGDTSKTDSSNTTPQKYKKVIYFPKKTDETKSDPDASPTKPQTKTNTSTTSDTQKAKFVKFFPGFGNFGKSGDSSNPKSNLKVTQKPEIQKCEQGNEIPKIYPSVYLKSLQNAGGTSLASAQEQIGSDQIFYPGEDYQMVIVDDE